MRITTDIPNLLLGVTRSPDAGSAEIGQLLATHAAPEALQHRLHFFELPEQAVHVLHLGAAALGDALPAAAVDDRRLVALARRHRLDDRLRAPELTVVHLRPRGDLHPGD